jgi:hypothetical protein
MTLRASNSADRRASGRNENACPVVSSPELLAGAKSWFLGLAFAFSQLMRKPANVAEWLTLWRPESFMGTRLR